MSHERTYRDASVVVALALIVATAASILLPFEARGHTMLAMVRSDHGDRERIVGLFLLLLVPVVFSVPTLIAAPREPGKAVRIIGRVLAFPFLLLLAVATIAYVLELRQRPHSTPMPWIATYGLLSLAALVAYVKSFLGGPWRAWAHVVVTPPATGLALFTIILSDMGPYQLQRLVGLGANVLFVTIGIFVPVFLYVLFPRRRTG